MAKEQGDLAIRSTYWGIALLEQDQRRNLPYDDESWEINLDMADIFIEKIDKYYGVAIPQGDADTPSTRSSHMESVATLLAKARQAHEQERERAPGLLLKAVQQRVREICPDEDPWDAVRRMAEEKGDRAIRVTYRGVMLLERRPTAQFAV